jgi:lipoprotein-releasing system permease protein
LNLPFYIARRYFLSSKKKQNAVNIISWISLGGIGMGTAALVVVLSVFNGFESLINAMYNSFDPQIKVELNEGKFFELSGDTSTRLSEIEGVASMSLCLEEKALLRYQSKEYVASIKGVDPSFYKVTGIEKALVQGTLNNPKENSNEVLIGRGVSYYLSLGLGRTQRQAQILIPKEGKYISNPDNAFHQGFIQPTGIFSVQADFDSKYIIAPLAYVQKLIQKENTYSSLEFSLDENYNEAEIIAALEGILGSKFSVKTRAQQHAFLFKIMQTERLAVFTIFTFILLIAAFNMVGSLTMLMLEKKAQIKTLWSLGLRSNEISRVFIYEGLLIGAVGGLGGLILGFLICAGQSQFGWVKLGAQGSFIINAYPVQMEAKDFLIAALLVAVLSMLSSWIPAKRLGKKFTNYIN